MKKIVGLLSLYRADSFFIAVFSFFVTLFIVQNQEYSFSVLFLGISLGAVFVNFIYAINSYFDADIDAINKPTRPIPSGVISKQLAQKYIIVLGVLSLALPFLYAQHKTVFATLYIFPLLGVLYSNSFFPFKKKVLAASFITAIILVLPATVAIMYTNNLYNYWYFILILFFYCFFLVPLKDIEDVKGDVAFNSGNWAKIAGEKKLLLFSLSGLTLLVLVIIIFRNTPGLILLGGVFLCSVFVELYFLFYKTSLVKLYKTLIISNLVLLVVGLLFFAIMAGIFGKTSSL